METPAHSHTASEGSRLMLILFVDVWLCCSWDWESATLELRNVHYRSALESFESRSLGGLLWPHSRGAWRYDGHNHTYISDR